MPKTTDITDVQPQTEAPAPASPETILAAVKALPEEELANIEVPEEVTSKAAEFAKRREQNRRFVMDKLTLIREINEGLEEAVKLSNSGTANAEKAQEASQSAALKLYRGWSAGALDAKQVTDILGNKFGWKKKGDSKTRVTVADADASATPFGMGETIRKRVVRAVRAHEFVKSNGTEGVAFFDTLDVDLVQTEISRLDKGEVSIFTTFDRLAALKSEANEGTRVTPAFNPQTYAKMTDKLGENISASISAFGQSESLYNSACDLRDMINLVLSELGVEADKVAA